MQHADPWSPSTSRAPQPLDLRHASASHYVELDRTTTGTLRTTVELGTDRSTPRTDVHRAGLWDGVVRTGKPR